MRLLSVVLTAVLVVGMCAPATASELTWVEEGQATATVILPDNPYPIARYAAQELVQHVRLATGATLPIITEAQHGSAAGPRIYVGATEAAEAAGIDHGDLEDECFVLRSGDGVLHIVGRDGEGHPWAFHNHNSGTLWGVYEVLERVLQVRWLWPGELGTVIPRADTVRSPAFDEAVIPRFQQRNLRLYLRWDGDRVSPQLSFQQRAQQHGIAFSAEGWSRYLHDVHVFLRRHRIGRNRHAVSAGHSFVDWWARYGEEHPEWFQLLPGGELAEEWIRRFGSVYGAPADTLRGQRGPARPDSPHHVSMCVSNPQFQREIVRRWQEARERNPGARIPLSIGENDVLALCTCDECRALDAPQPSEDEMAAMPPYVRGMYRPFDAGRRYALFAKQVHALASEIDPDVVVTAFIYVNYFACPDDVQLHPNIILSFCPWGGWWFPRDPREQHWVREQWQRWRNTGATLQYRPNYTFNGAGMPHVYARQMADILQYTMRHGSIGTDFDMLNGQWPVNGTTLYLLNRLHVRPERGVEELLEEYYLAFGPAAPHVKAYFDYWEAHTTANRLIGFDVMSRHTATNLHTFLRAAHELFPPESFERAEAILAGAAEAVEHGDPQYAQRVEFLQHGLTHARMTRDLAALFAEGADHDRIGRHVDALVAFRRRVEHLHIGDFTFAGGVELNSFGEAFDFAVQPAPLEPVTLRWEE